VHLDREATKKARIDTKRKDLLEEEAHFARLRSVFGTAEGLDILEWLMDICGFWAAGISDERALGKYELGRFMFHQVCLADIAIATEMFDRRRRAAEAVRRSERKQIEDEASKGA
jgi:hypothetical protein